MSTCKKISQLKIIDSEDLEAIKNDIRENLLNHYKFTVRYLGRRHVGYYFETKDGRKFIVLKGNVITRPEDNLIRRMKIDEELRKLLRLFKYDEIRERIQINVCNEYWENRTVVNYLTEGYIYTEILNNLMSPSLEVIVAHAFWCYQ